MKFLNNYYQIILIIIIALVLRLPLLNGSFWMDEAAQALEIIRPTSQQLDLAKDFQPPLLHLILHFSYLISGIKSEWFLRLVGALIPGLVTIWATCEIGKKLINKKAGLLAALLLSTSSFHIFYSQEIRPYSLPTMLATLSWLVLLNCHPALDAGSMKSRFRNKSGMTAWMLFFIFTTLGLYSSYLYPFLILSQIIYVLFLNRKIFKSFILSLFLSLLSFLPWLPNFLQQLKIGTSWQSELPGWVEVVSITQLKSLPLVFGKFLYGVIDLKLNVSFFLISFFIITLLLISSWQTLKQIKKQKALKIIFIWLIIPLLSAWLASFVIPVLRPKRVLYLLPVFYLLISYLVSRSKKSRIKSGMTLAVLNILILLSTNLISTSNYYLKPKYQREDWRALHAQIYNKFDSKSTLLIFSFDEPFAPWLWYEENSKIKDPKFDTLATGKLYINNINNLENKLESIKDYRTLLVFDYLRDLTDPDDKLLDSIREKGFVEVSALEANNTGFVRIYLNLNQD